MQRAPGIPCSLFMERGNADAKLGQIVPRECRGARIEHQCPSQTSSSSPAHAGDPVFQRRRCLNSRSRGVLDTPWVHETSATPARVLWRWDNVMASSALRSALRSTACMQAVNLKTKLRLRLTGRRRRSVGSCGATPGRPRSGPGATSLSGLSNWPSAGDGGMAASSWRASRTCGTAWAIALRWDIPQNRSLADWRWNMVVSSLAMS